MLYIFTGADAQLPELLGGAVCGRGAAQQGGQDSITMK